MKTQEINVMLTKGYEFTESNLATLESLRNKDAYPEIYGDSTPGNMKYLRTEIVDVNDIDINNKYFVQSVRAGMNPVYTELAHNIKTRGYSLAEIPIQVMETPDGDKRFKGMEGRTRYDILANDIGVKTLIVDIYEENSEPNFLEFSFAMNNIKKPSGIATQEDAKVYIENMVKNGGIDMTKDNAAILKQIREKLSIMGTRIKPKVLNTIVNDALGLSSGKKLFTSFPKPEAAKQWLKDNGYVDTDEVVYVPVASDVFKLYERTIRYSMQYPTKEVRMIVYSGTLKASDPVKDWTYRNLDIKNRWDEYRRNISKLNFGGVEVQEGSTYVYGCIPQAIALEGEYPLDKVVVYSEQ